MLGHSLAEASSFESEKRTREIFDKMDVNGDGVLSKDEFVRGCMADEFLYQMLTASQST